MERKYNELTKLGKEINNFLSSPSMKWNEQTAFAVLGLAKLPPAEAFEDLIEELVFEKRAYFLQQAIVPKLFESRVGRLLQIKEASDFLLEVETESFQEPISEEISHQMDDLESLLQAHVEVLQACRMAISQSLSIPLIAEKALEMSAYQRSFEGVFFELVSAMNLPKQVAPLQSDQLDLGKALYKLHHSISIDDELSKELSRIAITLG